MYISIQNANSMSNTIYSLDIDGLNANLFQLCVLLIAAYGTKSTYC